MADTKQHDLFFVRRNTNRNEVHYRIATVGDTHAPAGPNPISGYWQMHEKGPGITEPITVFEQMAFGVGPQRVSGEEVFFHLVALPEREIQVRRTENSESPYSAYILIGDSVAQLTDFYAFVQPAFLLPKLQYFEIRGLRDGVPVSERIQKS